MTVVGKILVFLNLVFSLVVGAFAVIDYTARVHWADAYSKVKTQNDVLRSSSETYKREADQLAKEKEELYSRLNGERVQWGAADQGRQGRRLPRRRGGPGRPAQPRQDGR